MNLSTCYLRSVLLSRVPVPVTWDLYYNPVIVTYISTTAHTPKPQSQEVGFTAVGRRILFPLGCILSFHNVLKKFNRILSIAFFWHSSYSSERLLPLIDIQSKPIYFNIRKLSVFNLYVRDLVLNLSFSGKDGKNPEKTQTAVPIKIDVSSINIQC